MIIEKKKMLAENYWKINGFQYHNKHIHEFEQKSEKTPLIFFNTVYNLTFFTYSSTYLY